MVTTIASLDMNPMSEDYAQKTFRKCVSLSKHLW